MTNTSRILSVLSLTLLAGNILAQSPNAPSGNAAGTAPKMTLDQRVTALEAAVASLKNTVTAQSATIQSLQTTVSA